MERVFKNSHYNGVYVSELPLWIFLNQGYQNTHFGCWGLIKFIAKACMRFI